MEKERDRKRRKESKGEKVRQSKGSEDGGRGKK